MIYCNKDDSQEASSQTPFLPLGFAFTTLYICQPDYSGGEDESMDGDINKYLVLAIICGRSVRPCRQPEHRKKFPACNSK
ncbi:hypothetical protein ACVXHA_05315 [Escherichia coli]